MMTTSDKQIVQASLLGTCLVPYLVRLVLIPSHAMLDGNAVGNPITIVMVHGRFMVMRIWRKRMENYND